MSKKSKAPVEAVVEGNEPAGRPVSPWFLGIGTLVVVIGGFAAAVAVIQSGPKEPLRLPEAETKPVAAAKPEPSPWTYDSVTDQHWDPNHKHWHKGHPPNQNATAPKPIPDIPNPEPWQYDEATDQHFNPEPGHNHWHGGKPPADKSTSAPTPAAPVAVEEATEAPSAPAAAPESAPAP